MFSRAPSIKGIFMQRPKVIRSLGMHIARASHGLLLSLSLLCSQPDSQKQTEKANDPKPVVKGPLCRARCWSVRISVGLSVSFFTVRRHLRHRCRRRRRRVTHSVRHSRFSPFFRPIISINRPDQARYSRVLHPCLAYVTKLCKAPNHAQV